MQNQRKHFSQASVVALRAATPAGGKTICPQDDTQLITTEVSIMLDWLPDQKSLYIATSSRRKNWKEIVAFPQIKLNGSKALLSFVNDHKHVISGRIESITETAAVFLIDRTGEGESLTIRALTDQDFYDICLQRKSNKWAVPQSKDELYSWYVG